MLAIDPCDLLSSILLMVGKELMWKSRIRYLEMFATFSDDAAPVLVGMARVVWLEVCHQDGNDMLPM